MKIAYNQRGERNPALGCRMVGGRVLGSQTRGNYYVITPAAGGEFLTNNSDVMQILPHTKTPITNNEGNKIKRKAAE